MDLEFLQIEGDRWVPVVNGVMLHSSVDPEREAAGFISREWERIAPVRSLVVYGLAGGFHINEALRRKEFNVVVIESDKQLAIEMNTKWPGLMAKIDVLAGVPPAHILNEPDMVEALGHSYAVLRHPASTRVSPYYYSAVSKILNDRTLRNLKHLSGGNKNLHDFFESLDISTEQILTLPMVEEAMIRRGSGLDREGLIWMALRELIV